MNLYLIQSFLLLQITEGLENAAKVSVLDGVLVSIVLALCGVVILLYKKSEKKNEKLSKIDKEYSKIISDIRKEHSGKQEEIRKDMLKLEEDRNRQWIESEKETLNVLNGVSNVLEMSEKMSNKDTEIILVTIKNVESKILDKIKNLSKNE